MLIDSEKLKQAILSTMPERSEVLLIVDNQPEGIVRCDDCGYSFFEGFVRERLFCEKHPELGEIKGDWFCADCWKAQEDSEVNEK